MAKYSSGFKLMIVLEYLDEKASLRELADKYGSKGDTKQIRKLKECEICIIIPPINTKKPQSSDYLSKL